MIKAALQYIAELKSRGDEIRTVVIDGKTYADKDLVRYDDVADMAKTMQVSTLSAVMDYIASCCSEFPGDMILHVADPQIVRLISKLDSHRRREILLEARAVTSEFPFNVWLNQEDFMINLQSNFKREFETIETSLLGDNEKIKTVREITDTADDLAVIMRMVGNIEKKSNAQYSDDGVSQTATINIGVGVRANALVPNPVRLRPYRTFQEVEQPESTFVFRIKDGDEPMFKLVGSDGKMWRNEAIGSIKTYFADRLSRLPKETQEKITVIG